ncbi:MAG: hypothetical protein ACR2H6_03955 [Pyrinomonadaceae bacterium]
MSRNPQSKFGFALTSISKSLVTALSATTALGVIVFLVAALYAGGPVAAKRLQGNSVAKAARNYDQPVQPSIASATHHSARSRAQVGGS